MTVGGYEELAYGPLIAVGRGQTEGSDDAFGRYREGHLEPVDPFGLRDASAESRLSGEEALTTCSHPNYRGDERGIQDMVNGLGLEERLGQVSLQGSQFGFEGSDPTVELALAQKVRKTHRSYVLAVCTAFSVKPERLHSTGREKDTPRMGAFK